jgi:bifunctional DNA-binding transcriptional regulator/antitoxin component of YhaV-PrlF toxin-antitoxin module
MEKQTEATITGETELSLPAETLRELGWEPGDILRVSVVGHDALVLTRRSKIWRERFEGGQMGNVWGDHEDTLRYLDEERASWGDPIPERGPDADR